MRRLLVTALPLLLLPAAALADGNVTTTQTADTITIKGDDAGNDFDVKHGTDTNGNDVLVIEGKNNTTINGQAKFEIRLNPGPTRFTDVKIEFSGGGDDITVDLSGLPEDRRLDTLRADCDPNGSSTIKNVQMSAKGDIEVVTGGPIVVEGCDAESLDIAGPNGGSVTVKECNLTKKLQVEKGVEGTEITIQDSFFGDIKNKSGNPVNVQNRSQLRVLRSTGRKVSYSGSTAEDEIAFEDSTIEQVSVKLGGGNDLISFAGSTIERVSVDGGPGDGDCLDQTQGGNVFGSFSEKGFEPAACLELDFLPPGSDPFADPPEGAVAWLVSDGSHEDGPFALPGAENPFALPVLDPAMLPLPAHWGQGPECVDGAAQLHHVHDAFAGHDDPNEAGCGHGMLSWGFLVPI